ncbi:cytochrome P450 [Podospora didyma]|uniref:Cytochrome P450 n=1 Tax=Podospora didyma TaxID=330526 RepID=A0AAE0U8R3_9PEZI|nr:cytochrome P450 [Podospora didyma]
MDNFTKQQNVYTTPDSSLSSNRATTQATTTTLINIPFHHILVAFLAFFITNLTSTLWKKHQFSLFAKSSNCQPVPQASNPIPMPWSLNRKYEVYRASVRGDLFEGHFSRKYARHGNTHAIVSPITRTQKGINTIEPENIQCVLATRFADYKRPEFRSLAAQPMLLPGLFTTDGPIWAHWRGMVRPQFTRKRFDANVADSERHMQLIFLALGRPGNDGWTGEVNLLDHMYRLTMDTATQFLFGQSAETQTAELVRTGHLPSSSYKPSHLDGFDATFIKAGSYVGHRIKLSNMYWLYDGLEFRQACRDLYRMVDGYVTSVRAMGKAARGGAEIAEKPETVIEEMEAQGATQKDMVEQTMHLLVAGMDTSAAALGWVFAMLAARPAVYQKLREEVVQAFGTEDHRVAEFNLETLKACSYLQHCLLEALRLFPAGPINVREAIRDTVLPVGGGPDGKSPVAVRKGARVQLGTYLTHRRKDIWGSDADEFRPERWEGRRRGWEFTPFSGGPQICVGQGYSMTQVSFVIARIAMRYDKMEPAEGSNNEKRSWMTVLTPGDGVRVRLHLASSHSEEP